MVLSLSDFADLLARNFTENYAKQYFTIYVSFNLMFQNVSKDTIIPNKAVI